MNQVKLINPSFLELDDAYRGLPPFNSLLVSTNQPESTILDMEQIGYVAISLISNVDPPKQVTVRTFKGKHGPCHFHGDTAIYAGQALAALDDDLHLLIKEKPLEVCEKTKRVLTLSPYKSTVKCQSKEDRQPSIIVKDFEDGISALLEILEKSSEQLSDRVNIFYPGPFRLLILQDGTIVRRGKCNSVPVGLAENLVSNEGCSSCRDGETQKPEYFQKNYSLHGSLFMKETLPVKSVVEKQSADADFTQLGSIDAALKNRLLNAITKHKKYFVLVGSDMDDESGCCPSREVTDANRLARHGILSSLRESTAGDSCPVTIFAFRDELATSGQGFSSKINGSFRKEIEVYLNRRRSDPWKQIVKWLLLVFVGISLALAVKQCRELDSEKADQKEVIRLLNPKEEKQVQLILFHNQKRCFQCLEMERQTKQVVEEYFADESENGKVEFKSIVMDHPPFIGLAERYQLFAATLVVVDFDGETIIREIPLLEAGSLYLDETAFRTRLRKDIQELLNHD